MMDNLQRIALFIDADNTSMGKLEAVIREISTHGRIVVKRAYGNWRKDGLKKWEEEGKKLVRETVQYLKAKGKKNKILQLYITQYIPLAIYLLFQNQPFLSLLPMFCH